MEEQKTEQKTKGKKMNIIIAILAVVCVLLFIAAAVLFFMNIQIILQYNEAAALKSAGKYSEAIAAFEALGSYSDSQEQVEKCRTAILDDKYNDAISAAASGEYITAYGLFVELGQYKDSQDQKAAIKEDYLQAVSKTAQVGSTVFFGSYEQDNNKENGQEDIQWIVLDEKDGKLLVISKYALDSLQFNSTYAGTTWERCTARDWMNSSFLDEAFDSDEQMMIAESSLFPDENNKTGVNQGNATVDKIFFLSMLQVDDYFPSKEEKQCQPTAYAVAQGIMVSENGCCWWWTRTMGINAFSAATVGVDGYIAYNGNDLRRDSVGIRPAMWIDPNA